MQSLSRRVGCWLCVVLGASSACLPTSLVDAQERSEYEVKAAVLYKIAKFIDWPSATFSSEAPQVFALCVVGAEDVARAFSSLESKPLQRRSLSIRHLRGDTQDLRQCHAVFFARDTDQDIDYALRGLNQWPILTVGETDDFSARGGVLTLMTTNDKIRFKVNLPASKRARLVVSSQLLQLATVVGE